MFIQKQIEKLKGSKNIYKKIFLVVNNRNTNITNTNNTNSTNIGIKTNTKINHKEISKLINTYNLAHTFMNIFYLVFTDNNSNTENINTTNNPIPFSTNNTDLNSFMNNITT